MSRLLPLHHLDAQSFMTPAVYRQLNTASRKLGELKGVPGCIPNQSILINTLGIQEAKDSSTIENIVTTHHELFTNDTTLDQHSRPAIKEVFRYRQALWAGYQSVKDHGLLTNNTILRIHQNLELNHGGYRKVTGTAIRNQATGQVVHTPPSPDLIPGLMGDLERFINDDDLSDLDPLVKMALIHYQFECIHPFYDGNGRTGRIINVLYLIKMKLLNIPILYPSRYILKTRSEYYRLFQAVQKDQAWDDWILYMLKAIESVAGESIETIDAINSLMQETRRKIKDQYSFYSQDLINNIFTHPYTTIESLTGELKATRMTVAKYLDTLARDGLLIKQKIKRTNYYINQPLYTILTGEPMSLA